MLRGVAILGTAPASGTEEEAGAGPCIQTLAVLPREELSKDDQELLGKLPKALLHRGTGTTWKTLCATMRCFCTVVADLDARYYVAALRMCLGQDPEEEVCACFWSLHPEVISATFVKSLASLTATAIQPGKIAHDPEYLAQLWAWLVREVPLPPPTCSLRLRAKASVALAIGASGPSGCLPVPHVPLSCLVQRLSLSSLLLLFRLALLERKVVMRSSSAFTLTACGEGISSLLLFPFRWQHSYLPVAPVQREYLQQKGPYILGLQREVLELGGAALTALPSSEDSHAFSVFDLDAGEVETEAAFARLPELPSSVRQKLRAGLSRLMANSGLDLGTSPARLGEGDPTFDREVQKVFFHSLAPLVTDLREFYTPPQDGASLGSFDVHGYVHSREPEAQIFARALSQTVAFRELLQETIGLARGDSRLERALVQEQLQPSFAEQGDPATAPGGPSADRPTDSFHSVARSSFASCPPDVPESAPCLTGEAAVLLGEKQRCAQSIELQLCFVPHGGGTTEGTTLPVAAASKGTKVASWQRSQCTERSCESGAGEVQGSSSLVKAVVAAVEAQAQQAGLFGQGLDWAAGLRAALAWPEAQGRPRMLEKQRDLLDQYLDRLAAGEDPSSSARLLAAVPAVKQAVSMCNVLPTCFAHLGVDQSSVVERLEEMGRDRDPLAEFEDVEAGELPVLNLLNRCLKTPRHPCLVAVDLLRRAFMCVRTVQAENLQQETAPRHTATEGNMKRVRFSRTATGISVAPSEDGSPEHLSPLAGPGRRARRSTTLASLSVSPSRAGTRSPISMSPERSRKPGRSSDPNVLTSRSPAPTSPLSPSRPIGEACELSPAVVELRKRFGELQACQPADLTHEEKLAFWLNVLNASTLAWLCVVGVRSLHSNLFPMHVWTSFLQRSLVNVGGQEFSLFEMEHTILRACSRAPKLGWFLQCQKGFKAGDPKADMALGQPAPEVSFGISYPFRFGCPPLRIYHAGLVREQLLLNCGQYLVDSLTVEDLPKRRVTLPPLLKYYGHDFGSSTSLTAFVQSALEATPGALDRLSMYGAVSTRDEKLGCVAPSLAVSLERLRESGSFANVSAAFAEFDWRLDVPKATCFGRRAEAPSCAALEALLHQGCGVGGGFQDIPCLSWTLKPVLKEVRVVPPPGRPGADRPDQARHRRYVTEG
ncbi:Crag [Symbiodinium natans]|uniref:Crag protein n=1 Tax=Symbiodinium natans TaxID=878477 RepID=A0A812N237_9DINO|nr:Crag [Symbiodinium natans]